MCRRMVVVSPDGGRGSMACGSRVAWAELCAQSLCSANQPLILTAPRGYT